VLKRENLKTLYKFSLFNIKKSVKRTKGAKKNTNQWAKKQ